MKMYKGFSKDMTCKNFQYEEGKTYEIDEAELCKKGFHACENPLDCFGYYAPGDGSVYREVELEEVSEETGDDSKRVGKKITIGAELSVLDICKAHFTYTSEKYPDRVQKCGDGSSLSGGSRSSLSGGNGSSLSGGSRSSLSGGDYSSLSGGDGSSLSGGDGSVCASRGGRVRGGIGSVLCAAELNECDFGIKSFACGVVDGEKIKADMWYKCVNGEFVEDEKDGE